MNHHKLYHTQLGLFSKQENFIPIWKVTGWLNRHFLWLLKDNVLILLDPVQNDCQQRIYFCYTKNLILNFDLFRGLNNINPHNAMSLLSKLSKYEVMFFIKFKFYFVILHPVYSNNLQF